MAARWSQSRTKEYDISGNPIVGATAYFYNVGTTTPQTVYSDGSLSSGYTTDNPVTTDGNGRWPSVYLSADPGSYRCRVYDDVGVLLYDDDEISVPLEASYSPPDAGSTDTTLLARTGDVKFRHGTGTHSGWVRGAGRTIGSASSGATERANADCEDLFLHLWDADSTLSVSGGRGGNAAADWAANKTIALPDYRGRTLAGLADMGNTTATTLDGVTVDNSEAVTTLGATLGASTVGLVEANLPAHAHTFSATTGASGTHTHTYKAGDNSGTGGAHYDASGTIRGNEDTLVTNAGGDHTHTVSGTTGNGSGTGSAHANVQPSVLLTAYVKL